MISILKFGTENNDLSEKAFRIREEVFVKEQEVDPAEEYDEFEPTSLHYLAVIENQFLGTARWRFTENGIKLERFAVLQSERGKKIGEALLQAVLADVSDLGRKIYLHAQVHAMPFYEKNGFVKTGPMFEEANIQHFKMIYQPKA